MDYRFSSHYDFLTNLNTIHYSEYIVRLLAFRCLLSEHMEQLYSHVMLWWGMLQPQRTDAIVCQKRSELGQGDI
jgi:hypothetical protein